MVLIQINTKILGEKIEKDYESESEEDDLIVHSKLKIALDISVLHALEKGFCQDVEQMIENDLDCPEEPLIHFLQNNPQFLMQKEILAQKLWLKTLNMTILELIFKAHSQIFIDEVEEHLNFYIENNVEIGAPKFVILSGFSKIAYEKLLDILIHYAHETDFNTKMCQIISDLVNKIHLISENPLKLQKDYLKPLVTLLLIPPNENASQQLSGQVMQNWSKIFQSNHTDAKNLCILYLPWLKCVLKLHPNFQIFLDFK